MLFYETLLPERVKLLKRLQAIPALSEYRLVGGTALALQIGHRLSDDLDLFGLKSLDENEISKALSKFGDVHLLGISKSISSYTINKVKVDIVNYPFPWLDTVNIIDGIRLATIKDIAAMKIAAITGRGSKKDFYDLVCILDRFALNDVFDWYQIKYPSASLYLALKSMIYFEDAEPNPDPISLINANWTEVKRVIKQKHMEYIKNHDL